MAILKIVFSTDSDCYTVINGETLMSDYVIYSTQKIIGSTKNKLINNIIKQLKDISFEVSDVHGTYNNGVFTPTKLEVPKYMNELKSELMLTLDSLKLKNIKDCIGFKKESGGNQYFTVEII